MTRGNNMDLNPDYYSCFKIEPIDIIRKNNLDFFQGNVVKYIHRYNKKHKTVEGMTSDLDKAISNIKKLKQKIKDEKS